MGCFHSKNKTEKTPKKSSRNNTSKSPPRSLLEEETVKEVLSETPNYVAKHALPHVFRKNQTTNASPFIKNAPLLLSPTEVIYKTTKDQKKHQNAAVLENDESSEICSNVSESVSVSTTATENKANNNGQVNGQIRQRSPARYKNQSFSGEVKKDIRSSSVGKSPGRRSEPSPGRVRPGFGPGYVGRRGSNGEGSDKRSRSPVMRDSGSKAGLGRTQSLRRTGKSPVRVGSGSGDGIRKESMENNWLTPGGDDESLENPLVSLECFIFL